MAQSQDTFEKLTDEVYRRFASTATRYYYTFRRPSVTPDGVPCMVFLGNHSSGKSTLLNWLLGGDPIQESGLAPTDDGFTVLLFGEVEEDVCGPAALARLPQEFHLLESFGDTFLQHLKVKIRNRQLLRTITLIDTPGMIDAAEGTVGRTYDFEGVVRILAEVCDMVFFLLDPDKPGTTGETVSVFSKCLANVEFKLRVLLNKCDSFSSQYDFARTYGTVCWNLARVLRTKDLPKIWTIYSGEERAAVHFDFSDFNRHRQEFLDIIHDAGSRRMDNVYSQARSDFLGLSMRMRIINYVARRLVGLSTAFIVCSGLLHAAGALLFWHIRASRLHLGDAVSISAIGLGVALGLLCTLGIIRIARRVMRIYLARNADDIFAREYRRELAAATHENPRQLWASIRDETANVIRDAPLALPLFGEFLRRRLDGAAGRIFRARTSGT